jgi:hypothetical protein
VCRDEWMRDRDVFLLGVSRVDVDVDGVVLAKEQQ